MAAMNDDELATAFFSCQGISGGYDAISRYFAARMRDTGAAPFRHEPGAR